MWVQIASKINFTFESILSLLLWKHLTSVLNSPVASSVLWQDTATSWAPPPGRFLSFWNSQVRLFILILQTYFKKSFRKKIKLLKTSCFNRTVSDSTRFKVSRLLSFEVLLTRVALSPSFSLTLSLPLFLSPSLFAPPQGKLVKYFSRQLSCKCKVALEERSAELEDFPRLGHWFRIVNLRKEVTQVKSPRWNLHHAEENCKSKLLTFSSLQPKPATTSD